MAISSPRWQVERNRKFWSIQEDDRWYVLKEHFTVEKIGERIESWHHRKTTPEEMDMVIPLQTLYNVYMQEYWATPWVGTTFTFLRVSKYKLNLKKMSGSRIEGWGYSSTPEHTGLVCARASGSPPCSEWGTPEKMKTQRHWKESNLKMLAGWNWMKFTGLSLLSDYTHHKQFVEWVTTCVTISRCYYDGTRSQETK